MLLEFVFIELFVFPVLIKFSLLPELVIKALLYSIPVEFVLFIELMLLFARL